MTRERESVEELFNLSLTDQSGLSGTGKVSGGFLSSLESLSTIFFFRAHKVQYLKQVQCLSDA